MQTFRISLKAARENAGLSVTDAARKIGISRKTLCAWEENSDGVSVYYYKMIADTYHLPIDVIFFGKEIELNSIAAE